MSEGSSLGAVKAIIAFTALIAGVCSVDENRTETGCEEQQQWDLTEEASLDGSIPIFKYHSNRTGLTVLVGKSESSIVRGYFCLATEASSDNGLPHSLEHLIFLGSEEYPYKDALDLMSKKCVAVRTNAWTAVDKTCYTLSTAESRGFLTILPVFMDHILYPLLRGEDFVTEVHHITKDGKDSGVVYSEMQGRENSPSRIMSSEMMKAIYPGYSGYKFSTGGAVKNLRENITIDKIRAYHKKYYRADNLYLTIVGQIEPEDVLKALETIERKVVEREPQEPALERPFHKDIEPLSNTVEKEVDYPSNDETEGKVHMGWRLPLKMDTVETIKMLYDVSLVHRFLRSKTGPVNKKMVDSRDPFAHSVYFVTQKYWEPVVIAYFEQVPSSKIKQLSEAFDKLMEDIIENGLDDKELDNIRILANRSLVNDAVEVEDSPQFPILSAAELDLMYSYQPSEDFAEWLNWNRAKAATEALTKPREHWADVLNSTFRMPRVLLKGFPSKKLNEKLKAEEKQRLKDQAERIGPEGLKEAGEALKRAIESKVPTPSSLLDDICSSSELNFTAKKFNHYNYTTEEQPEGFDLRSIPFWFNLEDIKSTLVSIDVFFDLDNPKFRKDNYLGLLSTSWMDSPLKLSNGTLVTLDDVRRLRDKTMQRYYSSLGYSGYFPWIGRYANLMHFHAKVEFGKYKEGLELFLETLRNVEFTEERIKVVVSERLSRITNFKKSATSVLGSLLNELYFDSDNNIHRFNFVRMKAFLQQINETLESSSSSKEVLDRLFELRGEVVKPNKMFVVMSADVKRLTETYGNDSFLPWTQLFTEDEGTHKLPSKEELAKRYQISQEKVHHDPAPQTRHAIVSLPDTDSCFMDLGVKFDGQDYESESIAPTSIMLRYLSDQLFKQVRGEGWTYGIGMSLSVERGRIRAYFYRASQLKPAFRKFRDILQNYTDNFPWEQSLFETARRTEITSLLLSVESSQDLSRSATLSYLRQTDDPYNTQRLLQQLSKVTLQDIDKVAKRYLHRFLDPEQTHSAIVCSTNEAPSMKDNLEEYGFKAELINDLEHSILA